MVWPLDCDWLVEPEDDWFVEAEPDWLADDDWLVEPEADWPEEAGWLVEPEADWFAEADEAEGLAEAEPDVPDEADWLEPEDAEAPATESRPGMSALACFACSIAAWVRGPMMPSTGPGSKPLSFRACCSCRTDSSPCAALPEAEAPSVALAELPLALEPLVELDAMPEDGVDEDDAEGWLVEVEADWLDEGWLAEADFDGSELDWPAAIAVPAAVSAATRASFVNFMVWILYRQLTAIRFVARAAPKFRRPAAPSDARHSGTPHGGATT